jgi:hypothetical protein
VDADSANPLFAALVGSTHLDDLVESLASAVGALNEVRDEVVNSYSVDEVLVTTFNALCNNGFAVLLYLFSILIAATVMLIIQLGVGADLCCYHPGDNTAWEEDADLQPKHVVTKVIVGSAPMVV